MTVVAAVFFLSPFQIHKLIARFAHEQQSTILAFVELEALIISEEARTVLALPVVGREALSILAMAPCAFPRTGVTLFVGIWLLTSLAVISSHEVSSDRRDEIKVIAGPQYNNLLHPLRLLGWRTRDDSEGVGLRNNNDLVLREGKALKIVDVAQVKLLPVTNVVVVKHCLDLALKCCHPAFLVQILPFCHVFAGGVVCKAELSKVKRCWEAQVTGDFDCHKAVGVSFPILGSMNPLPSAWKSTAGE